MDGTHNVLHQGRTLTTLVVRVNQNEEGVIVAWFIHDSKTIAAYSFFLQTVLKATNYNWSPHHFVLDFEIAERAAVQSIFPQTNITLCYFHLMQSVKRYCTKNQISKNDSKVLRTAVSHLQTTRSRLEYTAQLKVPVLSSDNVNLLGLQTDHD